MSHMYLTDGVIANDMVGLQQALASGANKEQIEHCLIVAIQEHKVSFVARILPYLTSVPREAFLETIRANSKECFDLVLPHFSLSDPAAMCLAASFGRIELVKLFAAHCDIAHSNSRALMKAAQNGHEECVAFLLNGSDPEDYIDAFGWAVRKGQHGCIELILPHIEDPQSVINQLNSALPQLCENWAGLEAKLQHQRLSEVVDHNQRSQVHKKI